MNPGTPAQVVAMDEQDLLVLSHTSGHTCQRWLRSWATHLKRHSDSAAGPTKNDSSTGKFLLERRSQEGHSTNDDGQNENTERRGRPPSILILPPLLSARKAPAVKVIKPSEQTIPRTEKVTKVVFRSTCVSHERVNLLKQNQVLAALWVFFSDRFTS